MGNSKADDQSSSTRAARHQGDRSSILKKAIMKKSLNAIQVVVKNSAATLLQISLLANSMLYLENMRIYSFYGSERGADNWSDGRHSPNDKPCFESI